MSDPARERTGVTAADLVEVFRSELIRTSKVKEEHVATLLGYFEAATILPAPLESDFVRNIGVGLWAGFRNSAAQTRQALEALCAQIPHEDWVKLTARNPGLWQLRAALAMMGDRLSNEPPPEPTRTGPPRKVVEHRLAWAIAMDVIDAMKAAGHSEHLSHKSDNGPVARVGARIMAKLLTQNVLPPATFADWVAKELET